MTHLAIDSVSAPRIAAAVALLAAIACGATASAQNTQNPGACAQGKQAAVQQIQQAYNQAYVGFQNQETDASTTLQNQTRDCNSKYSTQTNSSALQSCISAAQNQYRTTMTTIEDNITTLTGNEEKAMRIAVSGICAHSAAQLAQLISSLGQATSQIEQGTAQIISASKGKGAGSGSGGGANGGEGGGQNPLHPATPAAHPTKTP